MNIEIDHILVRLQGSDVTAIEARAVGQTMGPALQDAMRRRAGQIPAGDGRYRIPTLNVSDIHVSDGDDVAATLADRITQAVFRHMGSDS